MDALAREIAGFSSARLRKQCTRITTVTGRTLLETRGGGGGFTASEDRERAAGACGFVQDWSLDLQVGVVRDFLLLSSQDAAHDPETLRRHKVSHVLNVGGGVGVEKIFPELTCLTVALLDLPDTPLCSAFPQCFSFIRHAREQGGVVLVHCNAGVSRSASVVMGFLMHQEKMSFSHAYSCVRAARARVQPNPGFLRQLQDYCPSPSHSPSLSPSHSPSHSPPHSPSLSPSHSLLHSPSH